MVKESVKLDKNEEANVRNKREAGQDDGHFNFLEITGFKVVRYNIVNLSDA